MLGGRRKVGTDSSYPGWLDKGFTEFRGKTFGSSDELLHSAVLYSVLPCDFCGLTWNMGKGEGKIYQLQSAVKLSAESSAGGSTEIMCI